METIKVVQDLVPTSKYPIKCPYKMKGEFIIIHNTANDASAKNEIAYMKKNNAYTSYHFAIDDKEVRQGIPLDRNSFNAGDGANGKGNRKGISIEICYSKSGGSRFTKAEELSAKFVAQLLKERKWGIDKVTKHQDYMKKYCPHRTLDLGWKRYLKMVESYMQDEQQPQTPSNSASNGSNSSKKVSYYKKYTGKSNSLVDALKSLKIDNSFAFRKKIAKANGIKLYLGTASQNTKLLKLLKSGKLIKP